MSEPVYYRLCARCSRTEPCEVVSGGFLGEYLAGAPLCGRCTIELGAAAARWVRTECIARLRRAAGAA